MPWLNIVGYDPAFPDLAKPPMPADLVICTDVLEHVEPECLEDVLDDLRRLTLKALFVEVATIEAQKHMEDGTNAHKTVQPMTWWLPKLWSRFDLRNAERTGYDFHAVMEALKG